MSTMNNKARSFSLISNYKQTRKTCSDCHDVHTFSRTGLWKSQPKGVTLDLMPLAHEKWHQKYPRDLDTKTSQNSALQQLDQNFTNIEPFKYIKKKGKSPCSRSQC